MSDRTSEQILRGQKILVTGAAGQIGFPLAVHLAADNEVWGVARFSDPDARARLDDAGVRTLACDLGAGDFTDLPDDFTHVLHLAARMTPDLDYDEALRVNAEGTGLLLTHCRRARAALVMSTHSVYKPPASGDPHHVFVESDPLGDVNPRFAPTYSIAKIGQEAVARTMARTLDLPVTIARMNASYGDNGGLPAMQIDSLMAGDPVVTRWNPCMYSPIHQHDINTQAGALLQAASVPATIVNWAGDDAVSVQEWCRYVGELTGTEPRVDVETQPDTLRGSIADIRRRAAITGPCRVGWREGFRRTLEARHPERLVG